MQNSRRRPPVRRQISVKTTQIMKMRSLMEMYLANISRFQINERLAVSINAGNLSKVDLR